MVAFQGDGGSNGGDQTKPDSPIMTYQHRKINGCHSMREPKPAQIAMEGH